MTNRSNDTLIRRPEVIRRTGLPKTTIYRKIAAGTFPPQVRISSNCSGWYESDINAWVADPMGWTPEAEAA